MTKIMQLYRLKLACVVTFALASNNWCTRSILAQSTQPASNSPDVIRIRFSNQKEPSGSGRGTPNGGNRVGGGTRPSDGSCPTIEKRLTALVPETKEATGGITINSYPTFWFYVPYTAPISAKFVLLEKKGKDIEQIYEKTFLLTGKPGVVGFSLPSTPTFKPLEIGKSYLWEFSILCNRKSPSANPVVDGEVRRIDPATRLSPSQINQLNTAPLRDRLIIYATQGIWYEPLTLLGDRLLQNPSDRVTASDWADLLDSVGLANIATEPIVQRYNPQD